MPFCTLPLGSKQSIHRPTPEHIRRTSMVFTRPPRPGFSHAHAALPQPPPTATPTPQFLSAWAKNLQCYVGCTLLEAHPDGHTYNTVSPSIWLPSRACAGCVPLTPALPALGCTCPAGACTRHCHADSSMPCLQFVMAQPDGSFISHAAGSGPENGCSIVRKARAASMEAFIYR